MSLRIPVLAAATLAAAVLVLPSCATPQPAAATPITWQPWSAASFERARQENRPVLVYVEAVWCHWCHVMDAQTYGDAEVAALVSERFLPIRVDSDRRPDVAERYAAWGWPATAVLTPDAQPVLERRGYQEKDAFLALLRGVVEDLDAGREIARRPEPQAPALTGTEAEIVAIRDRVEAALDGYYHEGPGGWGTRQKYPLHAPLEQALLRAELRREHAWADRAMITFAGHAQLLDPVWGGLYQYSERGVWSRPHFEKIVPVQAEGIESFVLAYHATQEPIWLHRAERIDAYLRAFLRSHDGRYYTSQDADVGAHDPGVDYVEGSEYFALDDAGRKARGMPRVDTSVYADRNGMVIAALAQLYRANRDERVLEDARTAALGIGRTHRDARGLYRHAADDEGPLRHLSDQIAMARAHLALYEVTGDTRWRTQAENLATLIVSDFQDPDAGGFFAHTPDPEATGVFTQRRKPLRANGRVARFLARLAHVTEQPHWRAPAEAAVRALGHPDTIAAEGRKIGDFLMACEELARPPRRLTVVGWPDDARTTALFAAALSVHAPALVVELSAPGGRYPDTGEPAAYVCDDTACSSPLANPRTLAAQAREFLDNHR